MAHRNNGHKAITEVGNFGTRNKSPNGYRGSSPLGPTIPMAGMMTTLSGGQEGVTALNAPSMSYGMILLVGLGIAAIVFIAGGGAAMA